MSKRKSSDDRHGDCAAKRPKQHLYLLVDDWERGYSVRKLDVDAFEPDADHTDLPPEQFTEAPVARIEALHEISCNFISHGTKIFAMQPGETKPAIPAFDTNTLGLTICPWPSCKGEYLNPLFASVAAAGKLFLFTDAHAEALGDPPPYDSKAAWAWATHSHQVPGTKGSRDGIEERGTPFLVEFYRAGTLAFPRSRSRNGVPGTRNAASSRVPGDYGATIRARPPFYTGRVLCHALHPDGRTLFVSAGSRQRRSRSRGEHSPPEQGQGTFSFDAERLQWTRHGDWVLPFTGQAYFDAELEAWVGLCGERDSGAGRLCSCDVVAPVAAAAADEFATSAPSWKLGQEKLFRKGPQLHLGAKLLYMGDDSKFCLVESLLHEADEQDLVVRDDSSMAGVVDAQCPRPRRRVLRVTTFGLKYNKKGELQTKRRRAGAFKVYKRPHDFGESLAPWAFWL
ncbi:unnamed protein product [Urochloa humidicola]